MVRLVTVVKCWRDEKKGEKEEIIYFYLGLEGVNGERPE